MNWGHHFHFKGEKTKRELVQGHTDLDLNSGPLISCLPLYSPWLSSVNPGAGVYDVYVKVSWGLTCLLGHLHKLNFLPGPPG